MKRPNCAYEVLMAQRWGHIPIVGICFADPAVASLLRGLVRERGAATRDVTLDVSRGACSAAVIHDLSPWTDASIERFCTFHQRSPQVPVLLYVPADHARASMIGACAALRGVRLEVHKPATKERSILRQHVAWLLTAAPQQQLLHILRLLYPQASPRLSSFFRRALEQVSHGSVMPLTGVAESASALGISRRSLEREMPRPKRMLLWVSLLYVMLVARLSGQTPADSAETLGLARKRFYELRRTLLAPEFLPRSGSVDDLHWVLAAFVEEVRLPGATADQAWAALNS